ncbi:hypothetical protein E2562_039545 [Oryza meyeriana var. granulata]|uniref:Uncharacterized protein n=1 Tax=Oryza meyeriana var. granulata TaxID=110450 RepID=A0A6G1F2A2_9ORYZ|nr:hypothetical protein E2562_039545 [Oryza meyeriana var. granulata]
MFRVVVGISDVATIILPREDLTLRNNRGRVALQETLPKCDAKGIQERTSGIAPRLVWILGDGGGEVRHNNRATRAPGTGTAGVVVDHRDSRRPKEAGPAKGPGAPSALVVGETGEAVAAPPEANLPRHEGAAPDLACRKGE